MTHVEMNHTKVRDWNINL